MHRRMHAQQRPGPSGPRRGIGAVPGYPGTALWLATESGPAASLIAALTG
jgi:hypothetical protein